MSKLKQLQHQISEAQEKLNRIVEVLNSTLHTSNLETALGKCSIKTSAGSNDTLLKIKVEFDCDIELAFEYTIHNDEFVLSRSEFFWGVASVLSTTLTQVEKFVREQLELVSETVD